MIDEKRIKLDLEGRKSQLEQELARLTAPPAEGANVSFGKRVGEGTSEAVERMSTTATARSIAASIVDVERALLKLSQGTYGICDVCGEEIGEDRLEALPASAKCVRCAAKPAEPPG